MYGADGWCVIDHDPAIENWARAAHRAALGVVADSMMRDTWLQCQGTWFVGVDALPNDATGAVGGVAFPDVLAQHFAHEKHPAQLSVIYPGYPKPRQGESDAAFGYRVRRDAAHVDGILGLGTPKRRFVKEPHAYVLGIPLTQTSPDASPMVVWRGSHRIIAAALRDRFGDCDPATWGDIDVTEAYTAARRQVFDTCERVVVHVDVGAAYAMHPLALHGVAPWGQAALSPPEGRMIAYFRPPSPSIQAWLNCPD